MAVTNSYMLPHGMRCSDSPRVTIPSTCVASPTAVNASAARIHLLAGSLGRQRLAGGPDGAPGTGPGGSPGTAGPCGPCGLLGTAEPAGTATGERAGAPGTAVPLAGRRGVP